MKTLVPMWACVTVQMHWFDRSLKGC